MLQSPALAAVLAAGGALGGGMLGIVVTALVPAPRSPADDALEAVRQGQALPRNVPELAELYSLVAQTEQAILTEADLREQLDQETRRALKAEARAHSAQHKAGEANKVRTAFLTRMSHELRTPLNAVIGYSELVADELEESELVDDLRKVRRAGLHLQGLVTSILDLTQLESGKYAVHPEPVDLFRLVHDVVEGARNEAEANHDAIELLVAEGAMAVVDRRMVQSILFNLVHNAVKYTARGTITVRVTVGPDVVIFVGDTGIGMTERQLQQAFEPFEQADKATTRLYDGAGLGLAICRGFAEAMGGHMAIVSEVGQGAQVTVHLPAVVHPKQADDDDPDEPTMLLR